jgi:PAS domain S-box-containing protein
MANKRPRSDGRLLTGGCPEKPVRGKVLAEPSDPLPASSVRPSVRPSIPPDQQSTLLARLKTAEETLRAIQSGEVDALMVSSRRGEQVVALKGGEPAYRMLVEAMSEGAATLSRNGDLLYCNRRFAELVRRPHKKMIGLAIQSLVAKTERDRFKAFLAEGRKAVVKSEFTLRYKDGSLLPVHLSLNRFPGYKGHALGMVITDLSEQKRKQADEIKQAEVTRRLLLEHMLSAQEEERRRIARELHDETGQLLTSLLVGLRSLEHARDLADVRSQGHRLREIAAQTIDEVGRLARGLHPTVLDDHGLGVALSRYVSEYVKTHNIIVDLKLSELDSSILSSAVQIGLYRIVQEALTNVAKHSGAKAVTIEFTRLAAALEVAVVDDGCGFDAKAAVVSSRRLGIQSMRERAAMLGGTVSFASQRRGTKVLVRVALAEQDFAPSVEQRGT